MCIACHMTCSLNSKVSLKHTHLYSSLTALYPGPGLIQLTTNCDFSLSFVNATALGKQSPTHAVTSLSQLCLCVVH